MRRQQRSPALNHHPHECGLHRRGHPLGTEKTIRSPLHYRPRIPAKGCSRLSPAFPENTVPPRSSLVCRTYTADAGRNSRFARARHWSPEDPSRARSLWDSPAPTPLPRTKRKVPEAKWRPSGKVELNGRYPQIKVYKVGIKISRPCYRLATPKTLHHPFFLQPECRYAT